MSLIPGILHDELKVYIVCGNATFTQHIRRKVLEIMSKDNIIEFAEVEYRPRGFRNQDDTKFELALSQKLQNTQVTRLPDHSEVELAQLPGNVLRKAPRIQVQGRVHEDDYVQSAARVRATAFV